MSQPRLLFRAMFPCGINSGTEAMGSEPSPSPDIWTGFVLEHNVHLSLVAAVGGGFSAGWILDGYIGPCRRRISCRAGD